MDVFVLIVYYSYCRHLEYETASASEHGVVHYYALENLAEDQTVQRSDDSAKFDAAANDVVQKTVI